jgi:hypothetical protein
LVVLVHAPLHVATHTQTFEALQDCVCIQLPQFAIRGLLQLSVPFTVPQFFPSRAQKAGSVSATQTQTFEALHDWGGEQLPQLAIRGLLQLSDAETLPQLLPNRVQKAGSLSDAHAQVLSA